MRLSRKTVRPRLFKWFANVGRCDMHSFTGRERTNFINTIVAKNCAPKSCQSFQTLCHGACIASLAGSEAKGAELLARIFQDKFHQRDCPEKSVPKTCQTVSKRWAKGHAGHAWENFFAGGVFILLGVLSVDAWFLLPLQRSKLNDNPSIGYASAWTDRWGNSLGRALLGGSGTENAELLARVLHRAAFTQRSFTQRSFTRGIFYTGKLVHREGFTHRIFYTGKVLHTKAFTQRSLFTE